MTKTHSQRKIVCPSSHRYNRRRGRYRKKVVIRWVLLINLGISMCFRSLVCKVIINILKVFLIIGIEKIWWWNHCHRKWANWSFPLRGSLILWQSLRRRIKCRWNWAPRNLVSFKPKRLLLKKHPTIWYRKIIIKKKIAKWGN